MSIFSGLIKSAKERGIPHEDIIDSLLFYGQSYIRMYALYSPDGETKYRCLQPLENNGLIAELQKKDHKYCCTAITKFRNIEWLKSIIKNPVERFFWPSDVVFVSDIKSTAWVYPVPAVENNSMTLLSKQIELFNIHNKTGAEKDEEVKLRKNIVRELIYAGQSFFIDTDFRYCSWRADQIYLSKNNNILVKFSEHIGYFEEDYEFDKSYKDWCISYNPYFENYGESGDYYSFLILIFYVLIGRYPFESREAENRTFDSEDSCKIWNDEYRKKAAFIFAPEFKNDESAIGMYSHEQKFLYAWNDLSDDLRNLFIETFKKEDAMNAKQAFNKLCKIILN